MGLTRHVVSDRVAVALAVSAWAGCLLGPPLEILLAWAATLTALVLRRPWLLIVAVFLLTGTLTDRANQGLHLPRTGEWRGRVVLLTDPAPVRGGVQAEARVQHRHVRLLARGDAAGALQQAWAGEPFLVVGRLSDLRPRTSAATVRHLVGRLDASEARRVGGARPWWSAAHAVRVLVADLARSLPRDQRALFSGFVLGDDREQSIEVASDFAAAGLTHLLVVSGENVALVLTLAGPLLRRFTWRWRWALTLGVLVAFALVTRFEPSVLRAVAMATVAVTASAVGRPSSGWRNLALAVTALLIVDPFLARSVGFALSVAASAGIMAWSQPIARLLPGPRPLARVMGVTTSAQLGVAPILTLRFGGIPVATLPANLAAAPAAAVVVVVGLPGLILARIIGSVGVDAWAFSLPAKASLEWVLLVARWSARLPLGVAGVPVVLLASLGVLIAGLAVARGSPRLTRLGRVMALCALLLPAVAVASASRRGGQLAGAQVVRSGDSTVVVITSASDPEAQLEGLASLGVAHIDLLVMRGGGAAFAQSAALISHRWPVRRTVAPRAHRVRHAASARKGQMWIVGSITVVVVADSPSLRVDIIQDGVPVTGEQSG